MSLSISKTLCLLNDERSLSGNVRAILRIVRHRFEDLARELRNELYIFRAADYDTYVVYLSPKDQSLFNHSTLQQCLRIVDLISSAPEKKEYCGGVFLDVAQAFDRSDSSAAMDQNRASWKFGNLRTGSSHKRVLTHSRTSLTSSMITNFAPSSLTNYTLPSGRLVPEGSAYSNQPGPRSTNPLDVYGLLQRPDGLHLTGIGHNPVTRISLSIRLFGDHPQGTTVRRDRLPDNPMCQKVRRLATIGALAVILCRDRKFCKPIDALVILPLEYKYHRDLDSQDSREKGSGHNCERPAPAIGGTLDSRGSMAFVGPRQRRRPFQGKWFEISH
ncbi:hypothetical protein AAG570_012755 [Ranatra chinensis]|uniref:Uncharacterized protein n=1 Tax=Ranatra chinensis TaxID=642074 RepID=A0ABD0YER9_9HEMI